MVTERFDAVVVGAGPAGAVTALALARGGARVALVDKASFPRDKACGDVVGPRGVAALEELGLGPALRGARVGDMVVVGPRGGRARLPCFAGLDYPDHGVAVPRHRLDAALLGAAGDAGAELVTGRVAGLRAAGGVTLDDGRAIDAEVVVGADGATSAVADAAGLVEPGRVLWGFALRVYLEVPVTLPHIVLWAPTRNRAFPGYGWLFPGPDGRANAGLGIGTLADRRAGAGAARLLPAFLEHLGALGLVDGRAGAPSGRLGGWLKMGMVGTAVASGRVLLVGDAAGLVNPLQGEGIAHAVTSGRLAAGAVLGGVDGAAARYRQAIARHHLPYHRVAAALHAGLVGRPRTAAAVGRVLTSPPLRRALCGGWSIFWNELLDGAAPGPPRAVAGAASALGAVLTRRSGAGRWLEASLA